MKVCFLYPHLFGNDGYVRDINELYKHISAQGEHEILRCPPRPDKWITGRLGLDELALVRPLLKMLPQVDVLHLFGFFFPLYPMFAELARRFGKPYIISPLAQLEPRALQIGERKKRLFIKFVGQRMLNGAVFVHAFSESEAKSIQAIADGVSVRKAPLGIYYEDIPLTIAPSSLRPSREFFLFFGRLGYFHKGLDVLLDGFSRYRENGGTNDLVIAGRSWQGSAELIDGRISELGLNDSIRFVGATTLQEKFALLQTCRALVYPTRFDGPPRPIRDALALRKPLLVSAQANITCNIEDFGWGYQFDPVPSELAAAMARMEHEFSPSRYQDPMVELSWPQVARRYSELYRTLL